VPPAKVCLSNANAHSRSLRAQRQVVVPSSLSTIGNHQHAEDPKYTRREPVEHLRTHEPPWFLAKGGEFCPSVRERAMLLICFFLHETIPSTLDAI
jgi:hypothetical protein